ncbi:MAG TPA: response regulator [Phycisphaerales bacterium]|nr:response regulator [Phycisphaerales bacterium]
MARIRPKIVILAPPGGSTDELRELLREHCDVVVADSLGPQNADADFLIMPTDPGNLGLTGLGDHERDVLLNSVGEALCLVTAEGKLLWGNRMFDAVDPKTKEEVIAAASEAAVSFQKLAVEADSEPPIVRREIEIGEDRLYELRITPMVVDGTERYGDRAVGVLRDISHAGRVRKKMNAVERAGAALVKLDREAVSKMNAVQRLHLLEERIIKLSHDVLNYDHFAIRLIDEHTGRLEPIITSGFSQEAMELELYPAEEGNGTIGYVAATGESYICHDTRTDERYLIGAPGARSSLTIPLQIDEKIIGVMDVESEEVDAFDDQDRQFALIFGRYIAIALQMLDMLVTGQSTTGITLSGRFEGELREPLDDIIHEADELCSETMDPETARHVEKIREDVAAIRDRLRAVASGPNTLLGMDEVSRTCKVDTLLSGKRALIADDNDRIGAMIADVLRRRNCEVVLCKSGQEAINELEASAADGHKQFDFVLSDISMPDRNGYEVFSVARNIIPERAIILMTGFGYDPHHSIVRASQEGMSNVLYKPFQAARLIDEIHKVLTPPEQSA